MNISGLLILAALLAAMFYFVYNQTGFSLGGKKQRGNVCPRCDGKGHWYGMRHREECKLCDGTGYLED